MVSGVQSLIESVSIFLVIFCAVFWITSVMRVVCALIGLGDDESTLVIIAIFATWIVLVYVIV